AVVRSPCATAHVRPALHDALPIWEGWVVEPATFNGPGQIVVAGHTPAVERALELAREAGSRRTQLLEVSGPFHSSLLKQSGTPADRKSTRLNSSHGKISYAGFCVK